jgi:hypothetical protein
MSAPEAAATPAVVVEEAKPTEAAPTTDAPAPVQEASKVEETVAPVRPSFVFIVICSLIFYIRRL